MNRRSFALSVLLVLEVLIASGNAFAKTPPPDLFKLCQNCAVQQVLEAIAAGAKVNAKDWDGWTPVMNAAVLNPSPEVITALVRAGADVNAKNNDGATPLILAAMNNPSPEVTAALVKAGADVNAKDAMGKSVLDWGRKNKNTNVLAELMKSGAK